MQGTTSAERKPIRSFEDLEIFQLSYSSSLIVLKEIAPKLPQEERFDLADQLRRSSKAVPRLIAEGYAKRHQRLGFQKFLDDALGECNEMMVSLMHSRDAYERHVNPQQCADLIAVYRQLAKQVYRLAEVWHDFHGPRERGRSVPGSKP